MQNLPLFVDDEEPQGSYTVGAITAHIRQKLERDPMLQDIWVEGEISNLTRASSGHVYFTLKDADAQLKAVMWKTSAARLRYTPQHGEHVLAHGRISVYEPRGEYQLVADAMQPVGVGNLHLQFELLKAQLEAEGLFDPERKRSLPFFPRRIGVVTSPSAAAFQDVLNVLRRRFPVAEVILSPTLVQGEQAPPQIIAALERLYRRNDIDLILLVRGGGSLEDLWCFNDEDVVRKVVDAPLPVVTGVGHEVDYTLVDFAADRRAPTPSAAAELVTPEADTLIYAVTLLQERGYKAVHGLMEGYQQDLAVQQRSLRHLSPGRAVENWRQRADGLAMRLERGIGTYLQAWRGRLMRQQAGLQAGNPAAILARGYAIVRRAGDGKQLTDAIDADRATMVDIQLQRGRLRASVRERTLGEDG